MRDRLAPWRGADAEDAMTAAERQMLAALQPIWTADEQVIARWRHFGTAVTGVPPGDSDEGSPGAARLAVECQRLLANGGSALWREEPDALGGFGLSGPAGRYNADSLHFLRAMMVLQDAAVLAEFRAPAGRAVAWEIGGGWGGFAHHFTSICPEVTYLITAAPDLALLSAVYLSTLAPGARLRFFDPARPESFWHDWEAVDFAFAPESIVGERWPVPLDLTVDLGVLERMSGTRVTAHVEQAYASRSRYLLSSCPSGAADAAADVRTAFESRYWPHPVCVPRYLGKRLAMPDPARTFFLGWRRLQV